MEEEQYFQFKEQPRCILYIDGNYMLNISRALNIKLDMEMLFDELTKGMFRFRTYWFAALESSLDRNNNAYRFLDRLRYIPRTKVYSGRMTKRPQGHYETALRTDAGVAMATTMVNNGHLNDVEYHIIIAGDPEYVPAIKSLQEKGKLVKLVYPEYLGDLDPHPDLLKAADERYAIPAGELQDFEYLSDYDDDEILDDMNEEDEMMDDMDEEDEILGDMNEEDDMMDDMSDDVEIIDEDEPSKLDQPLHDSFDDDELEEYETMQD